MRGNVTCMAHVRTHSDKYQTLDSIRKKICMHLKLGAILVKSTGNVNCLVEASLEVRADTMLPHSTFLVFYDDMNSYRLLRVYLTMVKRSDEVMLI